MKNRLGFTLIELLVVMAIATFVCASTVRMLSRQQRFYSAATSMLDVRAQLRDGAQVLVADIRGAAVARYGLPTMSDSAVELYATVGSSAVCAISGSSLYLVPAELASGARVTSFVATPDTSDVALVYVHSPVSADSSRWEVARISGLTSRSVSTTCPPSSGFTSSADAAAGHTTFSVTLGGGVPSGLRRGAPVRFLRRGRYSLYRSGDGSWQLGYRRCGPSPPHSCSGIQPVSGPYRDYASGSATNASGLAFHYYDSSGRELFDAAVSSTVARVEVALRGETAAAVSLTGDALSRSRDSALVTISPRNRGRL
jgi:prepilin-type N-terminal cleavage/methylation domain-containing protein